jgi:hypothetical protein
MFECYDADKKCYSTMFDTAYDNVEKHMVTEGCYVKVYDDLGELSWTLNSEDDLIMFRECIARAATWGHTIVNGNPVTEAQKDMMEKSMHSSEYYRSRLKLPLRDKDHINPSHYQEYMPDMQWLEAMQYLPRFRNNPEAFKGAVELQIRKYLDRNGGKDEELQELSKALWYMKFLVAYTKDGKPIKIEAIDKILGE